MRLFTHPLWLLSLLLGTHAFYHYVRKPGSNTLDPKGIEAGRPGRPQIERRRAKPAIPNYVLKYALKYETARRDESQPSRWGVAAIPHAAKVKRSTMLSAWSSLHALLRREAEAPAPQPKSTEPRARAAGSQNVYPIVTATQPTFPTSLPIDQDGTDFSYFSTVEFGSSGKELHMLLDTGAASTWVMASDCLSQACQLHNKFGKPDSDTLTTTTKTWKVEYATGKVAGSVVEDTISLAGMDIDLSFGLASDVSDDFLTYPMDGILGLARPRPNELNVPSFLEVLKTEGRLKANVFGMSFQRHSDNTNDGEISFGDWNPAKMEGDLTWINTINDTGSWEIDVDDAGVADEKAGFEGKTAIIDSGTSFIIIPPADAKRLHSLLPGVEEVGEEFRLPCSSKDNVTFAFGGVSFTVSPLDYVGEPVDDTLCTSNIIGRQPLGPDRWLIGDVFLKNVYTVFDWDKNRIGFAKKAVAPNDAATTTNVTSTDGDGSRSASSPSAAVSASSDTSSSGGSTATALSRGGAQATDVLSTSADSPPSSSGPSKSQPASEATFVASFGSALCALSALGIAVTMLL